MLPIPSALPAPFEFIYCATDTSAGKRRAIHENRIVLVRESNAGAPLSGINLCVTGTATEVCEFLPWDPTASAAHSIDGFENESVRVQAYRLLAELGPPLLTAMKRADQPPLVAVQHADGSASIEWRFKDRQLTFSFEPNSGESGWHYVTSSSSGGVLASGGFSGMDLRRLVDWAANRPHA